MALPVDAAWFAARPASAVRDLFELCEQNFDAYEVSARELQRASGTRPSGGIEHQVAAAREQMRQAHAGDWGPYERHLRALGEEYAKAGLAFSAWYSVANSFFATIVARAVPLHAVDPPRLTQLLLVLGEYMERSLAIIATAYLTTKEQIERQARARHAQVLDAALDAVLEIDEQGLVTDLNRAAEHTFRIGRADAIGRSLAELVIPERFRDAHAAGLARFAATGEPRMMNRRVELCAMRSDGSEFPVELSLVAITDSDGRHRFTGFVRDLTEERRADASLALYSHVLEQAQFGIALSDPVTQTIINVNPAYAAMVGYEPAELIGTRGDRLVAPTHREEVPELRRLLEERGHHTYEVRLLRKDGTTVPVLAASSCVTTRSGAELRVSTVIDISERDRLEQARAAASAALARSAHRLELLARTAHEFSSASSEAASGETASDKQVALLDLVALRLGEIIGDGCVVRMLSEDRRWLEPSSSVYHQDPLQRDAARQLFGTVRQRVGEGVAGQVASSGAAIRIPEASMERLLVLAPPEVRPLLAQTGATSVLMLPMRARGLTIGVISLVRGAGSEPYSADDQNFAQDLADRAGLAIDNAMLVATLEQRVTERTATLEAVNRELEAFSYSVSHDLRTPLRAIDGFSRMLQSDHAAQLDDTAGHYLTRIRAATVRMSQLIDDLLGLARIAQSSLAVTTVDLSGLAAAILVEIQQREPARSVTVDVAPGLTARADARLIAILLENLLGNAWKFTAKHAGARIWFGCDAGAFFVRDSGAGFDMAYAEQLFVPFQRLHASHEYEGTGIGLATVHRIVTRHGGRIWARAEVGQGAAFFFTLGDDHVCST